MRLCLLLCLLGFTSYGQIRLDMKVSRYPIRGNDYYRSSTLERVTLIFKNNGDLFIYTQSDSLKLIAQESRLISRGPDILHKLNYQLVWINVDDSNGLKITIVPIEPFVSYEAPVYIFTFDRSVTSSVSEEDR